MDTGKVKLCLIIKLLNKYPRVNHFEGRMFYILLSIILFQIDFPAELGVYIIDKLFFLLNIISCLLE